jgi:hypothetical protein
MNQQPLELAEDSSFFIAFCKDGEHTFLALGAQDPQAQNTHTLCHVGKKLRFQKDYGCKGRTNTVFNHCDGVMGQDYKFQKAKEKNESLKFEYQAYEINRVQYLEFIQSLKSLLADKYAFNVEESNLYTLRPYYPSAEAPNTFFPTQIHKIPAQESPSPEYRGPDITQLSIRNNCRHTVISLVESFLPSGEKMTAGISKFAYQKLPYRATYRNDQIETPFYLFPIPPSKEGMDPKQYKILLALYQRLQKIPKTNPHSSETRDKFEAVKKLYRELQPAADAELTLSEISQRIRSWSQENAGTIDQCRYFNVRRTSTRRMVRQIEKMSSNRLSKSL